MKIEGVKKRLGYFGDMDAKEKGVSKRYEVNLCFIILKDKKNEDRKASIRFIKIEVISHLT